MLRVFAPLATLVNVKHSFHECKQMLNTECKQMLKSSPAP